MCAGSLLVVHEQTQSGGSGSRGLYQCLCRTSKRPNRIATPILYAHFDSNEQLEDIANFLRQLACGLSWANMCMS